MGAGFCSFKLRVHLPGTSHLNTKADKVMPGATNGSNWVLPIMNVLTGNSNSSPVLNPFQDYCIIGCEQRDWGAGSSLWNIRLMDIVTPQKEQSK